MRADAVTPRATQRGQYRASGCKRLLGEQRSRAPQSDKPRYIAGRRVAGRNEISYWAWSASRVEPPSLGVGE